MTEPSRDRPSATVVNRRGFLSRLTLAGAAITGSTLFVTAADQAGFQLNYLLGSCIYGQLPLDVILPEVPKTGARFLDVWPRKHGNQREQMDEMGHDRFAALLKQHDVQLGCITRYDLGAFGLGDEMSVARKLNCRTLVCGAHGPRGLQGSDLKSAVKGFAERMKPHLDRGAEQQVSIAIENHGNSLIDSPDSLKWLMDFRPSDRLKIALAPYHLETLGINAASLATLITELGNNIAVFYAWQHGMGCTEKLPKEQELLQLPGRGTFDFGPSIDALRRIRFQGFTEIFMHPVPRGIPILPSAAETTAEINRARAHLERLLNGPLPTQVP